MGQNGNEYDPYFVTGLAQYAEAKKEEEWMEQSQEALNRILEKADHTAVKGYETAALFRMFRLTGQAVYEEGIRQTALVLNQSKEHGLEVMPFLMAYETAYCKKEHYNVIVTAFKEALPLREEEFIYLTDVIDETSQEIYEVYDELCRLFRQEIRRFLKSPDSFKNLDRKSQKALLYALYSGCRNGVLLKEKYLEETEIYYDQMKEDGVVLSADSGCGLDLMILAQRQLLEEQAVNGI